MVEDSEFDARESPATRCVMCGEYREADYEVEVVDLVDYVKTPFGEECPGFVIGLCDRHHYLLRSRATLGERVSGPGRKVPKITVGEQTSTANEQGGEDR